MNAMLNAMRHGTHLMIKDGDTIKLVSYFHKNENLFFRTAHNRVYLATDNAFTKNPFRETSDTKQTLYANIICKHYMQTLYANIICNH